jgi:hypothetical protein
MLDVKTESKFNVEVRCDACGIAEREDGLSSATYVEMNFRAKGWTIFTVEIEHRRLQLCVCPKCIATVPWLRTFLINNTPYYP